MQYTQRLANLIVLQFPVYTWASTPIGSRHVLFSGSKISNSLIEKTITFVENEISKREI